MAYMSKNHPLVSVIVPVYKAEKFIDQCISSVIGQTYQSWELLLVDDGSPDKSGAICDQWAKRDGRIRVFHKNNGGVSSARNVAFEEMKGDYCIQLDSDDWLRKNCLKRLMKYAGNDFIREGFRIYPGFEMQKRRTKSFSGEGMKEFIVNYAPYQAMGCTAAYRCDIIRDHHLRMDTAVRSGEDQLFVFQFLYYCNSVKEIPYADWVVRSHDVPVPDRYRMHFDDLKDTIDKLIAAYIKLEIKFNCHARNYKVMIGRLCQYSVDDFVEKGIDEYFALYKHFYEEASINDLYNDSNLSPMNLILKSISDYNVYNRKERRDDLIRRFKDIFEGCEMKASMFENQQLYKLGAAIMNNDNKTMQYIFKMQKLKAWRYNNVESLLKHIVRTLFIY